MKKIINGKRYDTDTAKEMASWSNNRSYRDFGWCSETLYIKRTGEYFLAGEGGPMSRYAESTGSNSWSGGEAIRPMSEAEARDWAEQHLGGEKYEAIFGVVNDEDDALRATAAAVKALRASTGLSQLAFAETWQIPRRTLEDWEAGRTQPPAYVLNLLTLAVNNQIKEDKNNE